MTDIDLDEARALVYEADAKEAAEAEAAEQAAHDAKVDALAEKGWAVSELPRGEGFQARKWFQERGGYRVQTGATVDLLAQGIAELEAYVEPRDHE